MPEEYLTTAEAAERLGVSAHVLRRWQREGWLTPKAEGDGTHRRLFWSEKDMQQARDLQHQDSHKSSTDAFVDGLGGPGTISNYKRALEMLEDAAPGDLVVFSSTGVRSLRGDEPLGPTMRGLGGVAVILLA